MQTPQPEVLTAVTLKRTKLGWVVVEYVIQDDKIISSTESSPDLRRVAIETLRRKYSAVVARSAQ